MITFSSLPKNFIIIIKYIKYLFSLSYLIYKTMKDTFIDYLFQLRMSTYAEYR